MTVTYLIANNIGKVRLAIADIDTTTTTGTRDTWTVLFTDEEIDIFLAQASNGIWLAASYALNSVAASKAMLAKVMKLGDFSEDLTKLADSIRAQAQAYKEMVVSIPSAGFAEMGLTDFSYRQIIHNYNLRTG